MQAVYGDQCVDVSTVGRWVRRFKDGELGQTDLSDKTRSGRPVTASDQLHQDHFEDFVDLVILYKNNYAALKIIYVGYFFFYLIKIYFPFHFVFNILRAGDADLRF